MEFDLSKENIQPLRGGRNFTQLEVALQAQNDTELRQELIQKKRTFEEAISTYEGDDPLDNWYNYVYWVEQSYPKHGHEGNLIPLLEDCLAKFENDERYIHDRRLCKLWIKYIDLQQNPIELFQLLYSKGICVSCADLYRAWAFYHEISGDYKRADAVFQMGLRNMAQPFEELNFAHQNMFMAIGKEALQGIDEKRREEERHALTSLVSYNINQRTVVPSVRIGNNVLNPTPGAFPIDSNQGRENAPITLYEDLGVAGPSIGACASVSVLEVARNQEIVHKENALKPGTWKKKIISKNVPVHRQPSFSIHEDEDPQYAGGLRLPPDFAPMNFDDFSTWKPQIFFPEPEDDTKISMYPKHIVYGTPGVEFSIEEIKAKKWFEKKQSTIEAPISSNDTMQETLMEEPNIMDRNPQDYIRTEIDLAIQSILPVSSADQNVHASNYPQSVEHYADPRLSFMPPNISSCAGAVSSNKAIPVFEEPKYQQRASIFPTAPQEIPNFYNVDQAQGSQNIYYQNQLADASVNNLKVHHSVHSSPVYVQPQEVIYTQPQESTSILVYSQSQNTPQIYSQPHLINSQVCSQSQDVIPHQNYTQPRETVFPQTSNNSNFQLWTANNSRVVNQNTEIPVAVVPIQQWPNNTIVSDANFTQTSHEATKALNEMWTGPVPGVHEPLINQPVLKPEISKFQIHEDTIDSDPKAENRSSENKVHFSIYSDSETDNKRVPQPNLSPRGSTPMGYRKPAREFPRTPFSSQPLPEPEPELPRKTPSYSEPLHDEHFLRPADVKSSSGFTMFQDNSADTASNFNPDLNESCTTQKFNLNLKFDKVSTPFNYKKIAVQQHAENQELLQTNSKKLFGELDDNNEREQDDINRQTKLSSTAKLSTILETTKENRSSSSSSSSSHSANMLKTLSFHRKSLKAIPEISPSFEESIVNKSKMENENQKEDMESDVNNYDMVKKWLKSDTPEKCYKPLSSAVIDLTDEDSTIPIRSIYGAREDGGGDASQSRKKPLLINYESPMKNQFREMSCDSNDDSLNNSPVKAHKMDVDFNSSQSSSCDFKMDQDSEPFDETILQKVPSDPFSSKIIAALLRKIEFPNPKHSKHYIQMNSFPRLIGKKEVVTLMNNKFMVEKVIGKGAFGSVYKATNLNTSELVALKYQKPPNQWEYYISQEVQERCHPNMASAYMNVTTCFVSPTASILVSEYFKYGSLLDVANKIKKVSGKPVNELLSIYYTSEIITIVNTLHKCKIIHADIKPDNFLVTRMPPEFGHPSLQLIDFGNSIDMSLFPKGATFSSVVSTENFICTEMKERKPWTYQTDIFCIAATVHVLLFDKYMQVQKNGSVWKILQHIPRYMRQDLWNTFFFQMINIESCDQLPDLDQIKSSFDSILSLNSEKLQEQMRYVANGVLGK